MSLLLIAPSFFGYERAIADSLRAAGATVISRDERPTNSSVRRAVIRIAPKLGVAATNRHFRNILRDAIAGRVTEVILVKAENTPKWFLSELRAAVPNVVVVFYTFDSIEVSSRWLALRHYLDRAFSFDRADVEAIEGLEYKPLFFANEFVGVPTHRDLDLTFVGTLHGDRYRVVTALSSDCADRTVSLFFYAQAAWYFWIRKVLLPSIRVVPRSAVALSPLSRVETAKRFARSRAVIDIQRPNQSGLTMRTFEVLASGAALITTNDNVTREPFYDESRILVVSATNLEAGATRVREFVQNLETVGPSEAFLAAHGIDSWTRHLLDVIEEERRAR